MDADYLKENIGDVLSDGIAATIFKNPSDPVEYLANWLLEHVEHNKQAQKALVEKKELVQKDEERKQEVQQQLSELTKEEKQVLQEHESKRLKIEQVLQSAVSTEGLLDKVCEAFQNATGATGVYIAKLDRETQSLQYVACSKDHEWLRWKRLAQGSGVTHSLLGGGGGGDDYGDGNSYDDYSASDTGYTSSSGGDDTGGDASSEPESAEEAAARKIREVRVVSVPNVLLGPRASDVHFFKLPKLGSYAAALVSYKSLLNPHSLENAVAKQEERAEFRAEESAAALDREEDDYDDGYDDDSRSDEKSGQDSVKDLTPEEREARELQLAADKKKEDAKWLLDNTEKVDVQYALCFDTCGQNRRISDEDLALARKAAYLLGETLRRIDVDQFVVERKAREWLSAEGRNLDEEALAAERQNYVESMEGDVDEKGQGPAKEALLYKYALKIMLEDGRDALMKLRDHRVLRGPINVIQGLFYLLGYDKEEVCNADGDADWETMRKLIDENFFIRISGLEPNAKSKVSRDHFSSYTSLRQLLVDEEGQAMVAEVVREQNFVLAYVLEYVQAALGYMAWGIKQRLREKRRKQREEEEARRKLEEEQDGEGDVYDDGYDDE